MALQLYKIATVEVGSAGASTIAFTSIPQGYTDLKLVLSARSNNANTYDYCYINFNSNGYNASVRFLQGSGASASSNNEATGYIGIVDGNTATSSTFSSNKIYIPNYAGGTNKSFSVDGTMENNATTSYMHLVAGLWSNTAAINSITIKPDVNSFVQYTTATLYGIL
jgi:hypothetical protein